MTTPTTNEPFMAACTSHLKRYVPTVKRHVPDGMDCDDLGRLVDTGAGQVEVGKPKVVDWIGYAPGASRSTRRPSASRRDLLPGPAVPIRSGCGGAGGGGVLPDWAEVEAAVRPGAAVAVAEGTGRAP